MNAHFNTDSIEANLTDEKYEYLIAETLPSGRVSLLVGPSGAGKTRLFLQWAESWLSGEQILDKSSAVQDVFPILQRSCFR